MCGRSPLRKMMIFMCNMYGKEEKSLKTKKFSFHSIQNFARRRFFCRRCCGAVRVVDSSVDVAVPPPVSSIRLSTLLCALVRARVFSLGRYWLVFFFFAYKKPFTSFAGSHLKLFFFLSKPGPTQRNKQKGRIFLVTRMESRFLFLLIPP